MQMRFERGKPLNLLYTARAFKSGLTDVVGTIHDQNGNVHKTATLTELKSLGIYKLTTTIGRDGTYFVIFNSASFPRKASYTFVVGGSPGKVSAGGLIKVGPGTILPQVWTEKEKDLILKAIHMIKQAQIDFEKILKRHGSVAVNPKEITALAQLIKDNKPEKIEIPKVDLTQIQEGVGSLNLTLSEFANLLSNQKHLNNLNNLELLDKVMKLEKEVKEIKIIQWSVHS